MGTRDELEKLKADLKELKRLDPAHCTGTKGYIPHSMTPEHYQRIEDLEERIKRLESEGGTVA